MRVAFLILVFLQAGIALGQGVAIYATNPPVQYFEVSSSSNATTTSGTDAVLTGMTLTPAAGTYLVLFTGTTTSNQAGAAITESFYIGGVQRADSVRKISPFDGGTLSATSARGDVSISGIVTFDGLTSISVEWSTSGGTATAGPRTFSAVQIGQ